MNDTELDRFEKAELKRQKIIDYLLDNPDSTSADIEKLLGVTKASAGKTLRRMIDHGEVSRERHSHYKGFFYTWRAEKSEPISAEETKQRSCGFSKRRTIETTPAVRHTPVVRLFGGL